MNPKPSSVGRTVMIALIAGVLFAGFLALTPRLTAGSQRTEAAGPPSVVTTAPDAGQVSISDPGVSVSTTGVLDGIDEDSIEEVLVERITTTTTRTPGPEPDGSLTLFAELRGPRGGKATVILEDGDTVEWYFRVENSSGEELWGVYVYLEGLGHIWCDDTNLAPGAITECRATDSVWPGSNTAEAWATAWTTDHQVAAVITYEYFVSE